MKVAWLVAIAAAAVLSGCAERMLVPEILQQKVNDRIYTKYTIWCDDPENISSLNIQQGNVLPAGSEVEIVRVDNGQLAFRDMDGKVYVIKFYSGERMCTMRDFVRQVLTLTPPETLFDGIATETLDRIKKGEVVKGMTTQEVVLAYGPPPPVRTPDFKNSTWYYWTDVNKGVRVMFRGGTVRELLVLE